MRKEQHQKENNDKNLDSVSDNDNPKNPFKEAHQKEPVDESPEEESQTEQQRKDALTERD